MQQIGQRLKRARKEAGLSLQQTQDKSGGEFRSSCLGAYERGERVIPIDRFILLCAVYGVYPSALLTKPPTTLSLSPEEKYRQAAVEVHQTAEKLTEALRALP